MDPNLRGEWEGNEVAKRTRTALCRNLYSVGKNLPLSLISWDIIGAFRGGE